MTFVGTVLNDFISIARLFVDHLLNLGQLARKTTFLNIGFHLHARDKLLQKGSLIDFWIA